MDASAATDGSAALAAACLVRHLAACGLFAAAVAASAQCPPGVALPAQGAPLPGPLFPADNWWNADVRAAPVDRNSAAYVAFIGASRRLHPDFGGTAAPGSVDIYGIPYAVVGAGVPKSTVTFQYADESDGQGVPFYPIPAQAQTQAHWIEGGAPGSVDQRAQADRHLLIVDCDSRRLYELYNVWFDAAQARWRAGSGATFDLTRNERRPDGWTSADAAGLAILPGLVRYDEAWNPAVAEIGHAFRVTVRATNGYVFPASHRAGSTAGALPMGARLRLKTSVNGQDPALRTSDPNVRKIFRAMQKHGLIVADNGSDMYVSGTFDVRWNSDVLNPAFAQLAAGDFDVIELGWKPASQPGPAIADIVLRPAQVVGGVSAIAIVTLAAPAPAGGVTVTLQSSAPDLAQGPASVHVPAGATRAHAMITTRPRRAAEMATISASANGAVREAALGIVLRRPAP